MIRNAQLEYSCLKNEGFEDLLQECLIHWFFIKDQYRPEAGASERTFLNRITRNKLADIVRIKGANKRKVFYMSESLDALNDDEGSNSAKEKVLMVEEQVTSKLTAADFPDAMARATAPQSYNKFQSKSRRKFQSGKPALLMLRIALGGADNDRSSDVYNNKNALGET